MISEFLGTKADLVQRLCAAGIIAELNSGAFSCESIAKRDRTVEQLCKNLTLLELIDWHRRGLYRIVIMHK